MISTQGAHGIQDLVHLPEVFDVHGFVQVEEVLLDLVVVQVVQVGIGFVEQGQDGVGVAEVGRGFSRVESRFSIKGFIEMPLNLVWGMLPLLFWGFKWLLCTKCSYIVYRPST